MKTNIYIVIIGLIFGIFSGINIFMLKSTSIEQDKQTAQAIIKPQPPTPTPTPSDFCLDVPILTYHHIQPFEDADPKNQRPQTVSPGNFDWHMRDLVEKGYRFIALEELIEALHNRTTFDDKVIVLTLDDGYQDAYTYAYPIAQKYDITLNIGIITGLIGNPEHLTASHITTMSRSGNAYFHNHTLSHRNLKSADKVMIERQVSTAQDHLTELLGTPSAIVYYPYGVYNDLSISVLKEQSFDAAVELSLTEQSTQQCLSKIYALPRLRVGNAGPGAYDL